MTATMFVALDVSDRKHLALALDMLARRLRSDGMPLPVGLRAMRDSLAQTDWSRLEPTSRDSADDVAHPDPVALDLDEAAERCRVHRRTIERAVRDGELRSISIGRARRVMPVDLADWLNKNALPRVNEVPAGVAPSSAGTSTSSEGDSTCPPS